MDIIEKDQVLAFEYFLTVGSVLPSQPRGPLTLMWSLLLAQQSLLGDGVPGLDGHERCARGDRGWWLWRDCGRQPTAGPECLLCAGGHEGLLPPQRGSPPGLRGEW